jgi:arylsulfatase A-like enzyme
LGIVAQKKDLIVVTVDTLRADRLPFYGASRDTGGDPEQEWSLAWMAAHGTVLEQVYAQVGITLPSLSSLWTGSPPLQHGVLTNRGLLEERTFIMDLADAGWHAVGVNASGILKHGTGLERGFQSYQAFNPNNEKRIARMSVKQCTEAVTNRQPLLLWAHYVAPHSPYEPTKQFAGRYTTSKEPKGDNNTIYAIEAEPDSLTPELREHIRGLYDEEILVTNHYVKDLLGSLDSMYREQGRGGLLENAVVILSADHGEELGDRNGFFMHAKSLYAGVIQVPTIVLGEGWIAQRDGRLVALQDLIPWVMSGTPPQAPIVVSALKDRFFAVRDERWTLIHNPLADGSGPGGPPKGSVYPYPAVALFDRNVDPLEKHDVSADYPEETQRLLDSLHAWFLDLPMMQEQALNNVVDDTTLSELGYATGSPEAVMKSSVPWTGQQWLER